MGAKANICQIEMVARGKPSHSAGIGLRIIKSKSPSAAGAKGYIRIRRPEKLEISAAGNRQRLGIDF